MGQMLGCVRVKESNVGIKEVFEKYDDVLQPGCHYVPWYFGRRLAATHSLGFKNFNVRVGAITKDNVSITVVAEIQYRVMEEMVVEAHYKVGNPAKHISLYVNNAIRALVSKMNIDSIYEQRNEMATTIQKEIGKDMSAVGFEILKIFLSYVLDESLNKAMTDAAKLRVETKEKAEAEKILQLKRAETGAESKYLTGIGMARQFQAVADGVGDVSKLAFPENVSDATSSKDMIMDMVLVNQYFDTIKEITASGKYNALQVKEIATHIKDGLLLVQGIAAAKD